MPLPEQIRDVVPPDTAVAWELLPVSRQTIVDYWAGRHRDVIATLGRIAP
ncbi:hypothetical protein [Mycobacterium hubeiense]|nr:hypothetical protein [Mycobacterium sp. QGD 101]